MIDFIVRNFIIINKPQIQLLCNVELKQINYSISCSIKKCITNDFDYFYLFHCLVGYELSHKNDLDLSYTS